MKEGFLLATFNIGMAFFKFLLIQIWNGKIHILTAVKLNYR